MVLDIYYLRRTHFIETDHNYLKKLKEKVKTKGRKANKKQVDSHVYLKNTNNAERHIYCTYKTKTKHTTMNSACEANKNGD